jgi:hypothetical protein
MLKLRGDLHTDRYLEHDTNCFIGIGVGGPSLTHTTATEGWRNTAIGNLIMPDITTGYDNVGIGYASLYKLTSGWGNVALGTSALNECTTGTRNMAVGYNSLNGLTTGNNNVGMGYNSLASVTTSNGHVGIGYLAGTTVNSLQGTYIGYLAGRYDVGTANVAIGSSAMMNHDVGNYNVAVGYASMQGTVGAGNMTNNTVVGAIAANAMIDGANYNTLLGYGVASTLTTGSYNVMIGNAAEPIDPTADYEINIADALRGSSASGSEYLWLPEDGEQLYFGAGKDASITYDGSDMIFNPKVVGTGQLVVSGDLHLLTDNDTLLFGTGKDASIYYDGTDMFINPEVVGVGQLKLRGDLHTDRFLERDDNCFIGVGCGSATLSHTTGNEGYYNVGVGYNCMNKITTGNINVAIGYQALRDITTGYGNVAIGFNSCALTTTGIRNMAIGQSALLDNIGGSNNVAIGYASLTNNISGGNNVGLGYLSLYTSTTAHDNIAIGYLSSRYTTGGENTCIGGSTGYNQGAGTGNVFIGKNSGKGNGGSGANAYYSNIGIGISSLILLEDGAWGNIAIGRSTGDLITTGSYNIVMGYGTNADVATADYQLNIGDTLKGNLLGGATRHIWIPDDSEELYFGAGKDASILHDGTDMIINPRDVGAGNLVVKGDIQTDFYLNGEENTFLGADVAGAGNLSHAAGAEGWYNTAMGGFALYSVTTGSYNTSLGFQSMYLTTTGERNMALGQQALYTNVSGSYNVSMGYRALHKCTTNYNTAVGYQALSESTGLGNSGFGTQAGYDITSGTYNTCIGYDTGRGITTGGKNTVIGAQVSGLSSSLSNNIIISDGDGNVRIQVNSSGNVGIGVASANYPLQVNGGISGLEKSADPTQPAEGEYVIWMSDGTGKGDDGDVMIASTAGGTTNYGTLFDHSGGAAW